MTLTPTTLGNRPAQLAPNTRLQDFSEGGDFYRVSLRLRQGTKPDVFHLDGQAFAVDASGVNLVGPDGRPSCTDESGQTIIASSLGDTHTLDPAWVRKVGDYTAADFAVTGQGAPTGTGDAGDEYYDTDSGIGYRWDEGEALRLARGKVDELKRRLANFNVIAGISF